MTHPLYLIPCFIGERSSHLIPKNTLDITRSLSCFIVEREKTARAFLKSIDHPVPQSDLRIHELDKHNDYEGFKAFFDSEIEKGAIGVISEAGLPAVADPGSKIVAWAHQKGVAVKPLAGSSSIFLALMGSGLNGQNFKFHGYLPVKGKERSQYLKRMETETYNCTQIFMEAPYRNNAFLEFLISNLKADTVLCVAADLELATEIIRSKPVKHWKKGELDLHKRPCIFLIGN